MANVSKKASFSKDVLKQSPESPATTEKKKAKFYINVGVMVINSAGEEEFLQLPFGLAIDTMQFKNPTGNSEFAKKLRKQDELLRKTIEYFESLSAGDAHMIKDAVCEFRVASEETELDEDDEPVLKGFSWK